MTSSCSSSLISATAQPYLSLWPEILLGLLGLVALLLSLGPWRQSRTALYAVLYGQLFIFLSSAVGVLYAPSAWPVPVFGGLFHANIAHDLVRLSLQAIALVVVWLTKRIGQQRSPYPLEFYAMLLAGTVALMLLVQSSHWLSLFFTLEASALVTAMLLAMGPSAAPRVAFKFLLQSGLSAVVLLWGIALIYSATGSLSFQGVYQALYGAPSAWLLSGVGLVLAAIAFKLGLFPFGYYLPELYQRASYPVLGFVATSSKVAAVVVLINLLSGPLQALWHYYSPAFVFIAILTLCWSAISALPQQSLTRLLSLSGGVHISFVLVAVLYGVAMPSVLSTVAFYLFVYVCAMLLLLYCLVEVDEHTPIANSLRQAWRRSPRLGIVFAFALASMAGLPPLAGFMAKFLVIFHTVEQHQWGLLLAFIFASAVGVFYYSSFIWQAIGRHSDTPVPSTAITPTHTPLSSRIIIGVLLSLIILLGLVQLPGLLVR